MLRALQKGFYSTLIKSRLDLLMRPILGGVGTILMFHRLVPELPRIEFGPSYTMVVTEHDFRRVIAFLRESRIDIVTLDEVLRRLKVGKTGRPFTCVTFDDGYRDNYELLYPICRELEVPVTIYVTTDLIDGRLMLWWYGLEAAIQQATAVGCPTNGDLRWFPTRSLEQKAHAYRQLDAQLRLADAQERAQMIAHLEMEYGIDFEAKSREKAMCWAMVQELSQSDLVEIGGHTVSHPALSSLSEDEARREIADSRSIIEKYTSRPVRHFAYPFGRASDAGEREFRLCRELGFDSATTTRMGSLWARHKDRHYSLPRIGVYGRDTVRTLRADMSGVPAIARAALGRVTG